MKTKNNAKRLPTTPDSSFLLHIYDLCLQTSIHLIFEFHSWHLLGDHLSWILEENEGSPIPAHVFQNDNYWDHYLHKLHASFIYCQSKMKYPIN